MRSTALQKHLRPKAMQSAKKKRFLSRTDASASRKKTQRFYRLGFKVSHYALGLHGRKLPSKKPRLVDFNAQGTVVGIEIHDEHDELNPERHHDVVHQRNALEGQNALSFARKRNTVKMKSDNAVGAKYVYSRPPKVKNNATIVPTVQSKSKSFLEKMRSRLSGGQFRMLNEKLYTCSGDDAVRLFAEDPGAFQCYHAGYQEQMQRWPHRPVEVIIEWLKARSKDLIVADFGCGDGRLAKCVKNQVYSLDLVASNETIITCNMSHTPLSTSSVDVVVFCLSLMGTDYPNFLMEAHRVLKSRGWLLVAEVTSRFDPENGGADPDDFIQALSTLGFALVSKDFSNQMFLIFQFVKQESKGVQMFHCNWPTLKPCIYKRR